MTAAALQPPLGAPPTLEWVPIEALSVDASYQHSTEDARSAGLIGRIAKGWDWRLYQPLTVAKRTDGALCVIDGQHRLTAARRRGDIPHLPVVISRFDSVQAEAAAFEAMNRERKTMSRLERYRAGAVAGDPATLEAIAAITAAGLTLAPHSNHTAWKPGMVSCIGGIVRAIKREGRKVTEAALCALAEGFEGEVLQYAGSLLPGLVAIYADPPAGFDPDTLIECLGEKMQDEWRERGQSISRTTGWAADLAMRKAFLEVYEKAVVA